VNRRELLEEAGFYALLIGVPLMADTSLPSDVVAAYDQAVLDGRRLTGETIACPWNEKQLAGLLVAMAGFQGQQRLGTLLVLVKRGYVECPHCHWELDPLADWGTSL